MAKGRNGTSRESATSGAAAKGSSEGGESVASLKADIDEIRESLDRISKPYEELTSKIDMLGEYAQRYLKLLAVIASNGSISPALAVPELKDPIGREIITILAERGELNISQITERLRASRGSASRRIVRDRVREMAASGYLRELPGKVIKYTLAEEVVRKWSQMLTGLK